LPSSERITSVFFEVVLGIAFVPVTWAKEGAAFTTIKTETRSKTKVFISINIGCLNIRNFPVFLMLYCKLSSLKHKEIKKAQKKRPEFAFDH
jgi:hypothetical protein